MRATAAGSALASRFVGGATAGQAAATAARLRERHGIRASLFYLGEYVADPAIIEQTVGQTVAASPRAGGGGPGRMCRLIPPPSATRTATRWAATMRGASRRRRAAAGGARLGGAGHGGRRHPRAYLRAASGTAGRRLAGGPDAAGAAPAHLAGPGVGGAPAHLAAPGQGAFPVRALDHRGRARASTRPIWRRPRSCCRHRRARRVSCRCSAPMTIGWPARSWPWRANVAGRPTSSSSRCCTACAPTGSWPCARWAITCGVSPVRRRLVAVCHPPGGEHPRNAWLLARSLNSDGYAAGQG